MSHQQLLLPNSNGLSDKVKKSIVLLRNASNVTLDFNNEFIEDKVMLIQRHRIEFRPIAIEIVSHCDRLVKFGKDLNIFVESCRNNSVSNENLLEYLRVLLRDSERNISEIENTSVKIRTLEESVSTISDELVSFENDIKNKLGKIDPTTYNNLKSAESQKKFLQRMSMISLIFTISGAFLLISIRMTDTPADKTTKLAETALLLTVVITAIAKFAIERAAKNKEMEAVRLRETLNARKKQIAKKSKNLQFNVSSMGPALRDLVVFWNAHTIELERLVVQFGSSSRRETLPNDLVITRFEGQWTESIEEYKNYSQIIRNEVESDLRILENAS